MGRVSSSARLGVALALSVCVTGGCLWGDDSVGGVEVSGSVGTAPTVTIPKTAPAKHLGIKTLYEGDGRTIAKGDLVVANYVGYRWGAGGGELVADSYTSGEPAAFPYGHLVPGLDKALKGEKVGSRVLAVIPPKEGYGAQGYAPLRIGGTDSIVFVLDLIAAHQNTATPKGESRPQTDPELPKVGAAQPGKAPPISVPRTEPPGKLRVKTLVEGTGDIVKARQLVVFHDIGEIWRNGKVFESSWKRGRPDSVMVGVRQMITGWDRAVIGERVGSRVLVVVPPKDGYGSKGHKKSGIKGDDTLVFVVDILGAY